MVAVFVLIEVSVVVAAGSVVTLVSVTVYVVSVTVMVVAASGAKSVTRGSGALVWIGASGTVVASGFRTLPVAAGHGGHLAVVLLVVGKWQYADRVTVMN